jgi:hypothetical protein
MVAHGIRKYVDFKTTTPYSLSTGEKYYRKDSAIHKGQDREFDDYFPCRKKNCKLKHVKNWLKLFAHFYNMKTIS